MGHLTELQHLNIHAFTLLPFLPSQNMGKICKMENRTDTSLQGCSAGDDHE